MARLPALALLAASALAGCASSPATPVAVAAPPAPETAAPRTPVIVASTPVPNPPERARRAPAVVSPRPQQSDPAGQVARANAAARVQPTIAGYANALQVYDYDEGALYQVYTAPGQVTDIVLEPGETLSGTGPVAAGDTTRWIIGDTASGSGAARRVHILVKPTRAALSTNLVVNTDRRTYHIELRATAATYMASVSWRYPRPAALGPEPPVVRAPDPADLRFGYRIAGDRPAWRPVRVFDDGRQTFIEFPAGVEQSQLPPLFIGEGRGRAVDLVNYRVHGRRIIVDRLFERAELRLGEKRREQRVTIERAGEQ